MNVDPSGRLGTDRRGYLTFFLRGWRVAKCSKQKEAVPNTAIMVSTIMPRVEFSTMGVLRDGVGVHGRVAAKAPQ